jgi:Cys-tRNA(Pro)/Cys-tRNA(Cys) deacylase
MKTNAARLLDRLGIGYELRDYDVDPDDLSAEAVAAKIGVPLEEVWKTLIVRGDRQGICFAVVAGGDAIDLKALARLTGDRSAALVALKEVQPLTGYVRGGVTALGGKKDFPVFVEGSMQLHERVAVSAGVRGTQILIAPADYIRATNATVGPFRRAP